MPCLLSFHPFFIYFRIISNPVLIYFLPFNYIIQLIYCIVNILLLDYLTEKIKPDFRRSTALVLRNLYGCWLFGDGGCSGDGFSSQIWSRESMFYASTSRLRAEGPGAWGSLLAGRVYGPGCCPGGGYVPLSEQPENGVDNLLNIMYNIWHMLSKKVNRWIPSGICWKILYNILWKP